MRTILKEKSRLSTTVLLAIGIFDLVTTLILMNMGVREGNPLFAWIASYGSIPFATAKLLFLAGPVLILEYARQSQPKSAEQGTWLASGCYAFFYITHLFALGTP